MEKVLIVEGKNDRKRIEPILDEPVEIICTQGTLSLEMLDNVILPREELEVFIFVDEDNPGIKLRKQLRRELPNAIHLYTREEYRQVEDTPYDYLLMELGKYFNVHRY
ncbi:hypothetical protein [Alkalicoccus halolimnae]|uniref:Toprim domain-containing protein n=1 Tax=Alkalicoccus halolimnae TaxID=1667239 RepID=A0AAJ8LXS7_9BACI|nr:hypothetical protein [Alkalicoccus halolimnae]